MAAVTICSDFGAQQNKVSHCFHCFPIYLPWGDETGCHDLSFLNVEVFFFVCLFVFCLQSFFFLFFNLILFLNFTILYCFCQISKWIHHRYTCVPHPEPSSLLPPHTIPLGHPSAPVPIIQYCVSNLDWRLIPYMILYVFQCHSPKSSHPLPLPQSPKDCSLNQF